MNEERRESKLDLESLIQSLLDDQGDELQQARLEALLIDSAEARSVYLEMIDLHSRLLLEMRPRLLESAPSPAHKASLRSDKKLHSEASGESELSTQGVGQSQLRDSGVRSESPLPAPPQGRWSGRALAWAPLAASFLIGVLFHALLNQTDQDDSLKESHSVVAESEGPASNGQTQFVAQLISNTGTIVDSNTGFQLKDGARIRSEESFTVMDGVAQLAFDDGATLHLEGPARLSISSDGVPHLEFGKVLASLPWGRKGFVIQTLLGSVALDHDDAAGIALFGSELQVHAFHGEVQIRFPHLESAPTLARAGEEKRFHIGPTGRLHSTTAPYQPELFASRFSLVEDMLEVPESYVDSVRQLEPIAYWRFEELVGGYIQNEMAGRHAFRLGGGARIVKQQANNVLEFGFGVNSGYLIAEGTFDELARGDYALETWVKPGHFHYGTIAALVQRRGDVRDGERHGFLLEMLGNRTSKLGPTKAIRFLHRSPAGARGGHSCFSSSDYQVRRWQHLVVTKEDERMLMYVDGRVVAAAEDSTRLDEDLTMVVGQVFSFESVRPFVGQLDEFAVYDHALSKENVLEHYQLLRK